MTSRTCQVMTEFRGPCRNGYPYPLGRLGKSSTPKVPLKKSGDICIYIYICSQEMISNLIMIDAKRFLWWRTLSTIPLEMGEWKPPCLSEWDVLCHRWSLVIYDEIWWHMLTCANEDYFLKKIWWHVTVTDDTMIFHQLHNMWSKNPHLG